MSHAQHSLLNSSSSKLRGASTQFFPLNNGSAPQKTGGFQQNISVSKVFPEPRQKENRKRILLPKKLRELAQLAFLSKPCSLLIPVGLQGPPSRRATARELQGFGLQAPEALLLLVGRREAQLLADQGSCLHVFAGKYQ